MNIIAPVKFTYYPGSRPGLKHFLVCWALTDAEAKAKADKWIADNETHLHLADKERVCDGVYSDCVEIEYGDI